MGNTRKFIRSKFLKAKYAVILSIFSCIFSKVIITRVIITRVRHIRWNVIMVNNLTTLFSFICGLTVFWQHLGSCFIVFISLSQKIKHSKELQANLRPIKHWLGWNYYLPAVTSPFEVCQTQWMTCVCITQFNKYSDLIHLCWKECFGMQDTKR